MFTEKRTGWQGPLGSWFALLGGCLLPVAFAPFYFYPIAVLSLMLLFASWRHSSPRQAFWRGWLFGLGMFGVGVSWIYVAIHEFGEASVFLAGLLTLGFVAFLALLPAAMGWLVKRISRKKLTSLDFVLLLPVAWLGFEYLKSWLLTGFPWLEIGTSQIDGPLAGFIPVIGVYGVTGLVALCAGLLLAVLVHQRWWLLLPVILIWPAGMYLKTQQWTVEEGDPLTVSMIQGNVSQEIKWDPEQLQNTLTLYASLTGQHWDSDLIVWPENAATAFYHQLESSYFTPLAEEARRQNTDLLLGLPVLDDDGKRYYNSMVKLGEQPVFYHKKQLVPFGDYMPLEFLRGLIAFFDLPMSGFTAGPAQQPLIEVAGQPVGITICYEDAFTHEVTRTLPQATLLVNATNNAWYGDSFAPHQHLQISRSRALEVGRPVIRVTTNGISAFIDHQGQNYAQTPQFEQAVLTAEVQPRSGQTPYVKWGHKPFIFSALGLLIIWLFWRFTARTERIFFR